LQQHERLAVALLVEPVERRDIDDADIGQPRHAGARPGAVARREQVEFRTQFVEDVNHQLRAAPGKTLQRASLRRRKQNGEVAGAGEEARKPDAEQRVGGMGRFADGPERARLHDQPIAVDRLPRVRRRLQTRQRIGVGAEPVVLLEKAMMLRDEQSRRIRRAVERAGDRHRIERDFEQDRSFFKILAPSPAAHGSGVAGSRRHPGAEGAGYQQIIAIEPKRAALGLR
jgi:hypothetical protein